MKRNGFLAALMVAGTRARSSSPVAGDTAAALYRNAEAPIEDRVADLLKRMTIQEKTAQLVQGDVTNWINITDGAFNASGLSWNMEYRAGQVFVGYPTNWSLLSHGIRVAQDYLVNKTRLGIPALVQNEGIHGFLTPNATIFNSPIAHACSWNPVLVEKMAKAIGREAKALGVNQVFAPLGDLARELRYGRVEESYSEDGFLSGELAHAYVVGVQSEGVSATVKHFAGVASPEQGLNTGPVHGGLRELLTTILPPYKRAIVDAGAWSVMSAYHSYDGVPAVANSYMLTDILRHAWGYKYLVMSDSGATDRLCTRFAMCEANPIDSEAIVSLTLPAGGDTEMGGGSYSYQKIPEMIEAGKLDEETVNTAVSRVLRTKFVMGLFEKPFTGLPDEEVGKHINTREHVELARELDAESIVLLENRDLLPLSKKSSIAVIGPMGHGLMNYGSYVPKGAQSRGVTPYDGIRAASTGTVTFSQGCERWSNDESMFPEAIAAAKEADVAVVVVGTWSRDQFELWQDLNATTGEHVDTSDLGLVGAMARLVSAIINTGKPTVVVFSSGKPVTEPWISENATALLQQYYPGEQGGHALADVLFGNVNPSGRLSVGMPRSVGTLPVFYDFLNSGRQSWKTGMAFPNGTLKFGTGYVMDSPYPLYEFGYGKSYSTFNYTNMKLSQTTAAAGDEVTVSIEVTNNSKRDGSEVVQLYVKDNIASVVVPNIQLKGFEKVPIKAGETKTVKLPLKVADLGIWNLKLEYVVEPGNFTILIGSSSANFKANATLTVA